LRAEPGAEAAVDWRAKVELFEEIRREYEFGVGTILGVAKKKDVTLRRLGDSLHP
jgi:hypothetical protein